MDTQLIPHQTISTILDNVNLVRQDVHDAFALLQAAKDRLRAVLGDTARMSYAHLWDGQIIDYDLARTLETIDQGLSRHTWEYLFDTTGIRAYLTETRKNELDRQMRDGIYPALTVDNVLSTLQAMHGQLGSLLLESVREVFAWLRPGDWTRQGQLKTNKHWKIGPKVIIGGLISSERWNQDRPHFNYGRETQLGTLGNVLSLLDGQGIQQYPHDLLTLFQTALNTAQWGDVLTMPYFTAKPCKNGNLHIVWTRPDLIDRLNQLGADGSVGAGERD